MAKTISDLDDKSLLTLFENFPNLNILGVVGQVCSRWAEIVNHCKLKQKSVVIVVQNLNGKRRELREFMNRKHRFDRYLDGKVIDEAADDADHLFTAVATPNVQPLANQIRLSNATLEYNLEQIAEQFPRVTSLALVVLTTPDDLLLCLPLLQTYAAQLTKLQIYIQYGDEVGFPSDDQIAKHTEVLHCISTSMSALRHLTLNGKTCFFSITPEPVDLASLNILRQLDEFYFKTLDCAFEIAPRVGRIALENLNRRSEGTLQLGLLSYSQLFIYHYLENLLGTPQPNRNVAPLLRAIKHIALNLDETFFVHLPRMQHLVALQISFFFQDETYFQTISLTDLLRTIAQLPLLTKLQFYLSTFTGWTSLVARDKLVPAEEKTVSLPSVRYFEVQLNDNVWEDQLDHNFLDALRVPQTFPSLRVAMIDCFILWMPCTSCRPPGHCTIPSEQIWTHCIRPMLQPFMQCSQMQRIHLTPDAYVTKGEPDGEWIEPFRFVNMPNGFIGEQN